MPNYCYYEMHVKGKKENIEEFRQVMIDYERPQHFWRVFNADIDYGEPDKDGLTVALISGDCAWSVYSCMCTGKCTYADDVDESRRTSLQSESARLQLEIEVFSDEPGMAFQEHYYYNHGEEIISDCVDCRHYWFGENVGESEEDRLKRFSEFKAECGIDTNLTLDDLDDGSEIVIGGYSPWTFKF